MSFESAGKKVGSMSVNLIRLVMALVFLTIFCWIARGRPFPDDASAHAWLWLSVSGIIGFTIGDLCLFRAFVVVGARISMLLMTLVPPFTALLGWVLLGEHLEPLDWMAMAFIVGGVAWVVLERRPVGEMKTERPSRSGILLGIAGAAGQSLGFVLSKFGMGSYNAFAATQIRVIAGIVGFSVLFLFIGWWPRVFSALKNRGAMSRISLGAVFGPFLGVSLSLVAVQHTEAGVAATLMGLTPVIIIPPAIWINKERISPRAIIGAFVAVGGAALLFL